MKRTRNTTSGSSAHLLGVIVSFIVDTSFLKDTKKDPFARKKEVFMK